MGNASPERAKQYNRGCYRRISPPAPKGRKNPNKLLFSIIIQIDNKKGGFLRLFYSNHSNSYFTGTFFKVSTMNFQNFSTDAMFTLSTGECGCSMVGPNEIISQLG